MSTANAVVVDTDVFSRVVVVSAADEYVRFRTLRGRRLVLAAQTVAELRFGALIRNWGDERRTALESVIARCAVIPVDDALTHRWAELRAACHALGHALGQKVHDGDRWVAATAVHLGAPLATNDRIFRSAPGVSLF